MLLHNHLDMIGRNEPIQRKARFWQSYVRALKGPKFMNTNERVDLFALSKYHSIGVDESCWEVNDKDDYEMKRACCKYKYTSCKGTDDMRAPEQSHYGRYPPGSRGIFRPLLSDFPTWPHMKSMYDDPIHAADRITVPGYRYIPVSREIYGLSPRNIYPHHYTSLDRYPRHADHDFSTRIRGEFKHDEQSHFKYDHLKPLSDWDPETGRIDAIKALPPGVGLSHYRPFVREYSPTPDGKKAISSWDYHGQPIYTRGGYTRRPLIELMEPSNYIPLSRMTREPWWWQYPQYKPFTAPYIPSSRSRFYLRDSYLSPINRRYLWGHHPIRPFSTTPRLNF